MKTKKQQHLQRGQGMTEYLIIVALIAISAVAITSTAGQNLKVGFGKISASLQGKKYESSDYEKVTNNKVESRSLGNFNNGSAIKHD